MYHSCMSKRFDSYKQVRLLPETLALLEKYRKKLFLSPSVPKLVNVIVTRWLKERVK